MLIVRARRHLSFISKRDLEGEEQWFIKSKIERWNGQINGIKSVCGFSHQLERIFCRQLERINSKDKGRSGNYGISLWACALSPLGSVHGCGSTQIQDLQSGLRLL